MSENIPEENTQEESMSTLDYMKAVIDTYNLVDTKGLIILKNGGTLKIIKMFAPMRESWLMYKKLEQQSDKISHEKLLKVTNGGILNAGNISICVSDIAAMVEYKEEDEED